MYPPDFLHKMELGVFKAEFIYTLCLLDAEGGELIPTFNEQWVANFMLINILLIGILIIDFALYLLLVKILSTNLQLICHLRSELSLEITRISYRCAPLPLFLLSPFSIHAYTLFSASLLWLKVFYQNHTTHASWTSNSNFNNGMVLASCNSIPTRPSRCSKQQPNSLGQQCGNSSTQHAKHTLLRSYQVRRLQEDIEKRQWLQGKTRELRRRQRNRRSHNQEIASWRTWTCKHTSGMRWGITCPRSGNSGQQIILQHKRYRLLCLLIFLILTRSVHQSKLEHCQPKKHYVWSRKRDHALELAMHEGRGWVLQQMQHCLEQMRVAHVQKSQLSQPITTPLPNQHVSSHGLVMNDPLPYSSPSWYHHISGDDCDFMDINNFVGNHSDDPAIQVCYVLTHFRISWQI